MSDKNRAIIDGISMSIAALIAAMNLLESSDRQNLDNETLANFSWFVARELERMDLAINQMDY